MTTRATGIRRGGHLRAMRRFRYRGGRAIEARADGVDRTLSGMQPGLQGRPDRFSRPAVLDRPGTPLRLREPPVRPRLPVFHPHPSLSLSGPAVTGRGHLSPACAIPSRACGASGHCHRGQLLVSVPHVDMVPIGRGPSTPPPQAAPFSRGADDCPHARVCEGGGGVSHAQISRQRGAPEVERLLGRRLIRIAFRRHCSISSPRNDPDARPTNPVLLQSPGDFLIHRSQM